MSDFASDDTISAPPSAGRRPPYRLRGFSANLLQLLATMRVQSAAIGLQRTASSLTLLTLLAIVPIAAVGLLVLTSLPAFESLRIQVERFLAGNLFLPAFSDTLVRLINQFVAQAERLSAIGTIAFFTTAMTAMLTIDRTLNDIWRTPRPRPLAYRLGLYWAMLTLGPLALGVALAFHLRLADLMPARGFLAASASAAVPLAIGTVALAVLYRFAPNDRVKWRHALLGALVSMLMLEGLRRLSGYYVASFSAYHLVYGAFAILPLFLLWLYAIWIAVLLGALLTANLRFWGVALGRPRRPTPAGDFDRLIRVLSELLQAAGDRVPSLRFRPDFGGDPVMLERAASLLSSQGYLIRMWPVGAGRDKVGIWDEYWLAAPGLDEKRLRPLFDLVWNAPSTGLAGVAGGRHRSAGFDPGDRRLDRPLREALQTDRPIRLSDEPVAG